MKVQVTKIDQEKVTNMVGTFLNECSSASQFKRAISYSCRQVVANCVNVPTTQIASEKVVNTVTTFLFEDS